MARYIDHRWQQPTATTPNRRRQGSLPLSMSRNGAGVLGKWEAAGTLPAHATAFPDEGNEKGGRVDVLQRWDGQLGSSLAARGVQIWMAFGSPLPKPTILCSHTLAAPAIR